MNLCILIIFKIEIIKFIYIFVLNTFKLKKSLCILLISLSISNHLVSQAGITSLVKDNLVGKSDGIPFLNAVDNLITTYKAVKSEVLLPNTRIETQNGWV